MATGDVEEEGSQAPTPHAPVAPILETMSVTPEIVLLR